MPCGTFALGDHGTNPLVFVSAGVGVTPVMSILDYLGEKYKRGENTNRKIICIQINKSPERHPLKDHIDNLVGRGITDSHVFYTKYLCHLSPYQEELWSGMVKDNDQYTD